MSNIPKIPPVNISERLQNEAEILDLTRQRAELLQAEINELACQEVTHDYWHKRIILYQLQLSVRQKKLSPSIKKGDPDLMNILFEKKIWLESLVPTNWFDQIRMMKELFLTKLYIDQGTYGCMLPKVCPEWVAILKKEIQILLSVRGDQYMTKLERDIRIFYAKEELLARAANDSIVRFTQEEADAMINNKIISYTEIIDLLRQKRELLKWSITTCHDPLQVIDKKLEVFRLSTEIASKEDFKKRYIERKNILP